MHKKPHRRIPGNIVSTTAVLLLFGIPCTTLAADATWLANPGSNRYDLGSNWDTGVAPITASDTAIFGASTQTSLSFLPAEVGGWTFNAGAPAYSFSVLTVFQFTGAGIAINGGSANINNSGFLFFRNSSSAGSASITNDSLVEFRDNSTAGSASITNNSDLNFYDDSTAGSASITNSDTIEFMNSSAGSASITNNGAIHFGGDTTADSASITNNNTIEFRNTSTAGSATLVNNTGGTITFTGTTRSITAGSIAGAGNYELNANELTVGSNDTSTAVSGVISGTGGSLVKTGTGTLTLSGANTYTGDTIISAGTLQIGASNRIADTSDLVVNGGTFDLNNFSETVANLSGSGGNINIGAGGTGVLTVNQTVDQTYAGDFSGASTAFQNAFIKNGAATLTLTGTNSQTGVGLVSVDQGRLAVGGGNAIGNSQMVIGLGEFELLSDETIGVLNMAVGSQVLLNDNTLTIADTLGTVGANHGDISGTGNIAIGGTAMQYFMSASTYTGSTTINSGKLFAENSSALGNNSAVTVHSGGELLLRTNLVIGSLAGNGAVNLIEFGTNQLTSGGDNTSTIFSGVLSGAGGSLNKIGTGNLNLTGVNTYTGATTINGGILSVNGSIVSDITIDTGGTLGGSGTVGNVTINGGTLAPGNSIGTLNVAGNVDFSAGGTYAVEVNAAGASDLINATGTATLTNGTVLVLPEAGNYNLSTDYTILTAAGGLGGTTFNSVSSNLAFLTPTLGYDANNVFLNLTRNSSDYAAVAGTPNQFFVGTALDILTSAGANGMDNIFNNLNILTADGANQAYDSLSGVQHTHSNIIALQSINQFKGILFDRIQGNNQFLAYDGKLMLAHNDTGTMTDAGNQLLDGNVSPQRGWWLRGAGNYGEIDDTHNASGANYKAGGIAAGIDFDLTDNLTAGAAIGYTRTDADVANGGLDVDTYQAALYGRHTFSHDYYLTGMTGFGFHNMESNRSVTVGLLNTSAEADYDAWTSNIAIESGRKLTLNANADTSTSLTPFVGLEYAHMNRDSFTEKDGGVTNLHVNEDTQDSLRSSLGARISHSWTSKGYRITPTAELAWIHEFMEDEAGIKAGFSTAPATTFSVDGPDLDRDRARLALGLNVQLSNTANLNLGYQGEFASSDERHDIAATFRMVW